MGAFSQLPPDWSQIRKRFPAVYPVKFLESGSGGAPDYKEIEEAIGDGTRYLVISFVQFATGFRYDLARWGEICGARDMLFVVVPRRDDGFLE